MKKFKTILILLLIVLSQRTIAQIKLDTITAYKALTWRKYPLVPQPKYDL